MIKEKRQIDLIAKYAPAPACDVEQINLKAEALGDRGILRGAVPGFEVYGQPGCWQDAAVLYGIVELITATYEDSVWVRELLEILKLRKLSSIASMEGARLDLIELGGGDASSTVISPKIFDEFVAAKKRCGERADNLQYERFRQTLQRNKDALIERYGCKSVRFQVYVKEGKAALKATPVRG